MSPAASMRADARPGADGHCLCGAVRFRAIFPSRFVAHCHCSNCRLAHGAGVVTWAGFPDQQWQLVSGSEQLASYRTETGALRSFCSRCGTPLCYRSERWPAEVHVAVAAFTEALDREPAGHVYADRAPPWLPIHDDLPRFGGESGTDPLP